MSTGSMPNPPDNLNGIAREAIKGVYKMRDRLLLVLDLETITAAVASI